MARTHIDETKWQNMVRTYGIEDKYRNQLKSAIAAFNTQERKEKDAPSPEGDELLDELAKAAEDIKKKYDTPKERSEKKDLIRYLGGVADDARADKKARGERRKQAADEQQRDEEGEDDPELPDLTSALAAVKKRDLQFALCMGKQSAVALAPRVGSKHKEQLKKAAEGTQFVLGRCTWELEKHTFVVPALRGGLAKKIATALKTQTGKMYKVRVRTEDGGTVLDSDTDMDEADVAAAPQRFAARLSGYQKTLVHAKTQAPDEGIRILQGLKADVAKLSTELAAFERETPQKQVARTLIDTALRLGTTEIDAAIRELKAQAQTQVTNHCKAWMALGAKGGALAGRPIPRETEARAERAKELLHHINEIEEGVERDRAMLGRLAITTLDGALATVERLLQGARTELTQLAPRRSTTAPPKDPVGGGLPAPEGIKNLEGWKKACKSVDDAIANDRTPNPTDFDAVLNGAQEGLDAMQRERGWNWKTLLTGELGRKWDNVKARYRSMPDKAAGAAFMSGFWWFRKVTVDKVMRALDTEYGLGGKWKSVGSQNPESDYDISVEAHGTKNGEPVWDWQIVREFNRRMSGEFGAQTGVLFDTNLYASAKPPAPRVAATPTEKDMAAMTEAGQDVGALTKLRRYMSWEDYTSFQEATLTEMKQAAARETDKGKKAELAQRVIAAKRQFEEAEDNYFLALQNTVLQKTLLDEQKKKPPNAKTVELLKRALLDRDKLSEAEHAEVDRLYAASVKGLLKTDDPSIGEGPIGQKGQEALIKAVDVISENPDELMAITNQTYVDAIEQVRIIEDEIRKEDAKGPAADPDKRAALLARMRSVEANAVYFAAEAYHSEGPFKHIVQAMQATDMEVKALKKPEGMTEENWKKRLDEERTTRQADKLKLLSVTQFMQSFNEQMGDFLKDLKHYEHASPFPGLGLYRSSKYLERFCDAMIWIANKLEIERFPPDVISKFNAIKIDGKTPAQVKGGLGGLVAIRGGKKDFSGVEGVADQQQEKEAYSTEQVKQLFPSVNTLRDLGDIVKTAGREVNAVLRAAEAGQRMIAKNEQAYFPKKG